MPPATSLATFKATLLRDDPADLARSYVLATTIHALPDEHAYQAFNNRVKAALPAAERVCIVGSGNWRYSLNPEKLLTEYHPKSDVDVAVVSTSLYEETWEEMRKLHRDRWYTLDANTRSRLLRNGQNVYAGFACPMWIPQRGHPSIYGFKSMLNKLSGPDVGYREVKMMFFRNDIEMIDYYRRGFADAKRKVST